MSTELKGFKILIADDIPANLDVLRRILESEGYNIYAAPNGKVLMDLAHRAQPDLILLDIMMPELDGLEACRILKQKPETRDIPVIFISAQNSGDEIEKSFAAGAADFIHKPFKQTEVLARVKNQLKIRKLEKRNFQLTRELEYMTAPTLLNGLSDSEFIQEFIRWEALRHQRHQVPFSVIMADVDRGDQLRKDLGEDEWSRAALEIGEFFKQHSRKLDCAGLWEGQERFLILLPGTELEGAITLARKLSLQLKAYPFVMGGQEIKLSMSFGVSQFKPIEHEIDSAILHMIHEVDLCLGRARKKPADKIAGPLDL